MHTCILKAKCCERYKSTNENATSQKSYWVIDNASAVRAMLPVLTVTISLTVSHVLQNLTEIF